MNQPSRIHCGQAASSAQEFSKACRDLSLYYNYKASRNLAKSYFCCLVRLIANLAS